MGMICVFFEVGDKFVYILLRSALSFNNTVTWKRLLVVGFSAGSQGFDPWPVHWRFVMDKVALGRVHVRVIRFSPCRCNSTNAPYSSYS